MTEPLVPHRRALTLHGERLVVLPSRAEVLAEAGIAAGADWVQLSSPDLAAQSATAKCFRLQLADGETVYFKRDGYPLRRALGYFLRPSRNLVEAYAGGQLELLGIPTPEVLAVAERRRLGLPVATFVVTRAVTDSMDLRRYVSEVWALLPAAERRKRLAELSSQLIAQLQTVHSAGFFHQDLKWRNLLIRWRDDRGELFWIDAPRARRRRFSRRRGVVVDLSGLARVAVSVTSPYQRMRFLRAYLGPDAVPGSAARLYREVAGHLARRPPKTFELSFPADQQCR